uniref:Uncharacterized protein n=1 Tax=Anguilla anguilla TaxID=7936 RepID=A0A0E9V800_ANGAN
MLGNRNPLKSWLDAIRPSSVATNPVPGDLPSSRFSLPPYQSTPHFNSKRN